MNTLHVKKGDTVVVLSGKEKGKKGKIMAVNTKKETAVIEGINFVTCHTKAKRQGETGGIIKREAAIRVCKLMRVCTKCNKPTRVKNEISASGEKNRVCKHCGEII